MTKMNTEFANRLLLYPEVNKATGLTFKEFSSEQFPSAIIKKPPWLPFPVPRGLAILGICLYSKQVYLSLSCMYGAGLNHQPPISRDFSISA
jgi:hypothetical protein